MKRTIRVLAAVAFSLALAACKTPPAVYGLAEKTGANTGVLQGHLADLSASSMQIAQRRADHIVAMEAFNAQLDAKLKRELYMQQRARAGDDWDQVKSSIDELTALRDDLLKIAQTARINEAARRKELLVAQTELETYKAALRDTAAALAALSHVESDSERAKLLIAYARDVRTELKKALDSDTAAAKASNKLIDAVKADIRQADAAAPAAANP